MFVRPAPLSHPEIEKRMPVWCALADLFLDTELQPEDFDRLALTLSRSGFATAELRRMLENEVAPVFASNLMSVAGEWAGWPAEFVRDRIVGRLARRPRWRGWTAAWALRMIAPEWLQVERRLGQGRGDCSGA